MTQVGGVEPSVERISRGGGFVYVVIAGLLFVAFLAGGWLLLLGGALSVAVGAKAHANFTRNRGGDPARPARGGWAAQGCHSYCTRSPDDDCDCRCDCDGEFHGINAENDDEEERDVA
ncbi:hypothetical protein [Pseudonocardia parietis]|uniref:Uncharacterized protein n=1 Tax=Pseudonocardia parietis TaxID=570936 RepID=A0ABS4W2T5_9PSEU|nr:hypothetical protein [Pseudonocardia parietis]MBP2370253.1 hypothetical protein [Pseudonocardia parietis]